MIQSVLVTKLPELKEEETIAEEKQTALDEKQK